MWCRKSKANSKVAVVNTEGELLLLERSPQNKHRPGTWDFVGGLLKWHEQPAHGAIREGFEETGLYISDLTPFGVYPRRPDSPDYRSHMFGLVIPGRPEIRLSPDEHSDGVWLDLARVGEADMPQKYKDVVADHLDVFEMMIEEVLAELEPIGF